MIKLPECARAEVTYRNTLLQLGLRNILIFKRYPPASGAEILLEKLQIPNHRVIFVCFD